MTPLLRRVSRRALVYYPWQVALALLGIALGVAVVIAIDLANASAYRAFTLATESIVGRATHWIVGGPGGLAEELYVQLRLDHGMRSSAPIVEGTVYLPGEDSKRLRLLGVDPFAEQPFRDYLDGAGSDTQVDIAALLTQPGAVALAKTTARQLGLKLGDQLTIRTGTRLVTVTVVGIFEGRNALIQEGLKGLLIADIATAQALLGQIGKLSRIDLILPSDAAESGLLARLERLLPPGVEIIPASSRSQSVSEMTCAFRINLTALSLLALLVGGFLVYNTVTFLWLQRRRLIGLLRVIGVTRRQIFMLLLMETLGLGVLGAVAGTLLGIGLGEGLIGLVSRTINDLYFAVQVREIPVTSGTLAKGILLGLGTTLVATLIPALEATRVPPGAALRRSLLESQARRWLNRAAQVGGTLLLAGGVLLFIPTKSVWLGFVGLTGLQVGCALLTPVLGKFLLDLIRPFLGRTFGVLGQLASRGIVASLSRTGVAMAALTLAVSATVGMGIMIDSFRLSVSQWLSSALQADLYITIPGSHTIATHSSLDPDLIKRIKDTPGVAAISTTRQVRLQSSSGFTHLVVLQPAPQTISSFQFIAGDPEKAWHDFTQEGAVLISESYAYHHDLSVGSTLRLRTGRGPEVFTVAGIYRSYGSDRGVITLHRRTYVRYWSDRGISGISVYASPEADLDLLRQKLLQQARQQVEVRTHLTLRKLSLQIFDHTFAITEVVRLLAGLVAFVGIFSALMALQLERTKEFGILRAMGLTPQQLRWLTTGQTGLMGLICGLFALPMGILTAAGLIYVIIRRSFGWSMEFIISPAILLEGVLLAFAAALLAGFYPAWRMARIAPAEGLREE